MQSSLAQFQIIKVFTHFIVQCKHKLPQQVDVGLRTTASTPQRTEEEYEAVLGNNMMITTNNYLD